jgi:hypothetical protein
VAVCCAEGPASARSPAPPTAPGLDQSGAQTAGVRCSNRQYSKKGGSNNDAVWWKKNTHPLANFGRRSSFTYLTAKSGRARGVCQLHPYHPKLFARQSGRDSAVPRRPKLGPIKSNTEAVIPQRSKPSAAGHRRPSLLRRRQKRESGPIVYSFCAVPDVKFSVVDRRRTWCGGGRVSARISRRQMVEQLRKVRRMETEEGSRQRQCAIRRQLKPCDSHS